MHLCYSWQLSKVRKAAHQQNECRSIMLSSCIALLEVLLCCPPNGSNVPHLAYQHEQTDLCVQGAAQYLEREIMECFITLQTRLAAMT